MPGRKYSAANSYRYGFNGKENDNDVKGEGNQQDYGMRIYDPRLGKFLSVDPISKNYPWYTPYQFAGNKPITFIDLDGLEEALPPAHIKTIIIVIQGYAGYDPIQGRETQVDNNPRDARDAQLGSITSSRPDVAVYTFSSSNTESTKNDILATIRNFRRVQSGGKVVLIGHSQGADNITELAKENRNVKIDFAITLDIKDAGNRIFSVDDNNIYGNVKNIINYYQTEELIGGEDIDIKNKKETNGANILSPGSNHRSLDNDLLPYINEDVENFLNGQDPVKKAKERTLPTFDPKTSGSPDILKGSKTSKSKS